MKKQDLLENIQKKIDICDLHISQNPYLPALKRVGYVINNKCKTLDMPLYINAIYNEEQLRLNTDVEERNKFITTNEKTYNLEDISKFNEIMFRVIDEEKRYYEELVRYEKNGITDKHGNKVYELIWTPVISGVEWTDPNFKYVGDAKQKIETINNNKDIYCSSIAELIRKYSEYRNIRTRKLESWFPIGNKNNRQQRVHTVSDFNFRGYVDVTDFINQEITNIINEENKKNDLYQQDQLYTWECCGWDFYTNGKLKESFTIKDRGEEINQDNDEDYEYNSNTSFYVWLDDIIDELAVTKQTNSSVAKLLNEMKELRKIAEEFEKKYFTPYYLAWKKYDKKYGYDKETSKKRTNAFKEVKNLLDKAFNVILKYENKISLNSGLSDYIVKYKNFNKIYNLNQDRPTITKFDDSSTAKKMLQLMKLKQQILDSGNAKLQEYYNKKEIEYQLEKEKHIQLMLKNADLISKKEKEFVSILDPLNLRYNGLKSEFIEQINFIIEQDKKKIDEILKQYDNALLNQTSGIKLRLVVKFRPSNIPEYFYYLKLGEGFVYEELLKKIEEIVKRLNEKKKNDAYLATAGKDLYNKNLNTLRELETKRTELNEYLNKLENHTAVQSLQSLKEHRDNNQSNYTKEEYAKLNQGIYDYLQNISSLLELIQSTKKQIDDINNQYYSVSQQCYYYETQLTPLILETSKKYDIYDEKADLLNQLKIINVLILQAEVIRAGQVKLNQSIMLTNQNYVMTNSDCESKLLLLELKTKNGADFNDPEVIQLKNEIDYLNSLRIQYSSQLEKLKTDYMSNLNHLKEQEDFRDKKKNILEQLEKANQKIKLLNAPLIELEIDVTEEGTKYKKGYNFSSSGKYKNIYIDTQKENEWLVLRLELKKLYSYYNNKLPSGEIREPKTSEEEKHSFPLLNLAGEITTYEDENENCKCNWFIPMDFELFGPGIELPIKLTTKVYKTDKKGEKIPIYDLKGKFVDFQTLRRLMAVQNGYGYIFTGLRITLYYTGLPGPEPISVFISGAGLEYGTILAGGYVAVTPFNIYQMKKYPYQNDDPNGQFYWLQTGAIKDIALAVQGKLPVLVTFKIYKKIPLPCGYPKKCGVLKPEEYANRGVCGLKVFFETTYDIFTQPDESGFDIGAYMDMVNNVDLLNGDVFDGPAGKLLSKAREAAMDGIKGAMGDAVKKASSDLLSNISNLTRFADSAFEKVYDLYEKNAGPVGGRAAQFMLTKRNIAEWGNTSLSLATNTWNIGEALDCVDLTRKGATEQAQSIINNMKGALFDLIPPECQDTICQTMKEAKQDSIRDLGLSVEEATNINVDTLTNFVEKSVTDMTQDLKDKASKIIDGVQNVGSFIGDAIGNFFDQFDFFSLTQYCPRRLADVTKDINPLKQSPTTMLGLDMLEIPDSPDVFSQLGSMIGLLIIGNVMNALNNCVTRSITNNNINYSSLFPENTRKYLEAANSVGDIANMAKGIGGYKMSLEDLFHEANRSSILDNFANINTDDISLGYLTDFLNERGISDVIDVDSLLKPNETINNLQNTIGKAVSNNNDIIDKLKKGEILSMNDQYKQIAGEKLNEKTQDWAKGISDKVNAVTSIGLNAKGLLNTDFSQAWKDPHVVTNKLQNITNTMNNMFIKQQAKKKKEEDEYNEAFSESDLLKEMKYYLILRWQYLEKLTKLQYLKQKEEVDHLSINI